MHVLVVAAIWLLVPAECANAAMSRAEILEYRERARHMFQHAYEGYMRHGYPYDEVKPRSCQGFNTWGNFSLTLVDSMSTLIVMGNTSEFENAYNLVVGALNFDVDFVTSVFESNIRVLGGLLSAHMLLHRTSVNLHSAWPCSGRLLDLAVDLADRLLPAFDTPTKMPYGSINLRHGVPPGETTVTCAAGVGTFVVEFGVLSRLTGDMRYENAALAAMQALHNARAATGLIQSHIDVSTGQFTLRESSIGSGMDSYFEYMLKGAILLHNRHLLDMFNDHYRAIRAYLWRNGWYITADAQTGNGLVALYQSLDSFFPGLQTLKGDTRAASQTANLYTSVWRHFGSVPEMYDIVANAAKSSHSQYPLRPELIESVMYLYRATADPFWLDAGRMILDSIDSITKAACGYCSIVNVSEHNLEDRMHSYFLSETVKYLYLLFDEDNFIFKDSDQTVAHQRAPNWTALTTDCQIDVGGYIFSTEAHPFNLGTLGCCFPAQQQQQQQQQPASEDSADEAEVDAAGWTFGAEGVDGDAAEEVVDTEDGEFDQPAAEKQQPHGTQEVAEEEEIQVLTDLLTQAVGKSSSGAAQSVDVASAIKQVLGQLSSVPLTSLSSSRTGDSGVQWENSTLVVGGRKINVMTFNPSASMNVRQQLGLLGTNIADGMQMMTFPATAGGGEPPDGHQLEFSSISHRVRLLNQSMALDKADVFPLLQTALHDTQLFLADNVGQGSDVESNPEDASLSDSDLISSAAELIAEAKSLLERRQSARATSSVRYIDLDAPFGQDLYLADEYTVSRRGLQEQLEVFGGTVQLETPVT